MKLNHSFQLESSPRQGVPVWLILLAVVVSGLLALALLYIFSPAVRELLTFLLLLSKVLS